MKTSLNLKTIMKITGVFVIAYLFLLWSYSGAYKSVHAMVAEGYDPFSACQIVALKTWGISVAALMVIYGYRAIFNRKT